jgi:hypothetical protein
MRMNALVVKRVAEHERALVRVARFPEERDALGKRRRLI